jgi:hypothetical protein
MKLSSEGMKVIHIKDLVEVKKYDQWLQNSLQADFKHNQIEVLEMKYYMEIEITVINKCNRHVK